MKELEITAKKDLLNILERYLECGLTEQIKIDAEKVYLGYLPAQQLIRPDLYRFVGCLFPLAYPYLMPVTGVPPTKEKVKELIEELKKIKL